MRKLARQIMKEGFHLAKYRKKPVVIEAFQWHPSMGEVGGVFFQDAHPETHQHAYGGKTGNWCINTPEGALRVSDGDWIITGVKGEKYPCKPDIFAATYEVVEG